MTKAGDDNLTWDENGRLVQTPTIDFDYNWSGKLRNAVIGSDSISIKYDPSGNRVWKQSTVSSQTTNRKFIVDITGGLPVILCEIDSDIADANRSVTTKYYYANAQILKQEQLSYGADEIPGYYENVEVCYEDYQPCILQNWCDPGCCYEQFCHIEHPWVPPVPVEIFVKPFYYVHDRLGSIRLVLNHLADVNNTYTYNPYGEDLATECTEAVYNPFKFTGQWYDDEIGQYYLRARMYSPYLARFTGRDLVMGDCERPLSLHKYLYCENSPEEFTDPFGLFTWKGEYTKDEYFDAAGTQDVINACTELVGSGPLGVFKAFSLLGPSGKGVYDMKDSRCIFTIGKSMLKDTEFGNYLAGYSCYYNYGTLGGHGVRRFGDAYSLGEYGTFDDADSKYFLSAGILKAQADRHGSNLGKIDFVNAKFQLYRGLERAMEYDPGSNGFWDEMEMFTMFWNNGPSIR